MRIAVTTCLGALLISGLALPAAAQSLAARQKQASNEERLDYSASDISRRCGGAFSTGFDWGTFSEADYAERRQPYSFCEGAVSAIRAICDDPAGKAAVAQTITGLVCAKGGDISGEIRANGTYYVTFDWASANIYYWHLENLRNKL